MKQQFNLTLQILAYISLYLASTLRFYVKQSIEYDL